MPRQIVRSIDRVKGQVTSPMGHRPVTGWVPSRPSTRRAASWIATLSLALSACSANHEDDEAVACSEQTPPCSAECMTITGNPIVDDCFQTEPVDLACAPEVIRNGQSSCARDDETGVSYRLSSGTYRQLLEEKPNWFDCDGNWSTLPACR